MPYSALPLVLAFPEFSRHKIKFGTQFYSATVRQLEVFVRQLCTKVRIRRTKEGIGVRMYNVRKCGMGEHRMSYC